MLGSRRGLGPLLTQKEMTQTVLVTPTPGFTAAGQQRLAPGHLPPWALWGGRPIHQAV